MYIAFGNRVLDSNDIKNIIEENTEFKVIKDMSKGSKREDIVAFNLSLDIDTLNKEISETINISEEDEDTLFEEYMATTEELGFELEEYLPEDSIMDFKAYKWEPSDNDIKGVLVMANEELGNNKLKDVDQELLDSYPSEFREKYNKYKTGTSPQWQELDEKNTICIKYTDLPFVFPPWASLYSDLSDLQSYKDTAKAKDANSAYKLLGLQIPLNDKSEKEDALKVSTTTALSFFDMINSSLPEGVGAFLSPMKFEKIDFATNEASEKNKILDAETSLFLSTGISPINFGRANTSTGLNASNLVDSGKLFNLYRKFERWLNRKMKFEFNGKFSIQLLDVTTFTVKEEIAQYQSLAQYGVPCKLQLAALCGITAIRERGMNAIEEALDIANTWKPLNSSFTTSGNTDNSEDVGRPKSEDSELSDSGEKSRDTDNGGR